MWEKQNPTQELDEAMSGSSNSIRILAVDDHPLFRQGIVFSLHSKLFIVFFENLDAMIAIRSEFPEARIIILTTYTGDVQVLRAMKVGARAYLLKSLLDKELLETIRAVHAGKKTLSAEASYELAEHATDEALTPGEADVLRLIAAGNSNKQIAAQLSITEETVKGRVKNILSKLGANDRTHAAMIGVKRGIIQS